MLAYDLAHRRETQAVPARSCREEPFENSAQGRFVHAAAGVADRNANVATGPDGPVTERSQLTDVVHLRLDVDTSHSIHGLRGVDAEIEDHLLQLDGLGGYDRRRRRFANHKFDCRRQRRPQQRRRFGDQGPQVGRPAMGVATTPESHDLIDEVARSFSGPPNLAEAMCGPAVGLDSRLGHLRIAEASSSGERPKRRRRARGRSGFPACAETGNRSRWRRAGLPDRASVRRRRKIGASFQGRL